MNRLQRILVGVAALLAAGAVLVPVAGAGGNQGDVNLARGILQTQYGFSPGKAIAWTTGVCSYPDKPSSCYLTEQQAAEQSQALAEALGVPTASVPAVVPVGGGFHWSDAGIGAGATLGL